MLSTSAINTLAQSKEENLDEAKVIVTKLFKSDPLLLLGISKIIKTIYDNKGWISIYNKTNSLSCFMKEQRLRGHSFLEIVQSWGNISEEEKKLWISKAKKINDGLNCRVETVDKLLHKKTIRVKQLGISLYLPVESKDISKTDHVRQIETIVQEVFIISLSEMICSYLDNDLGACLYSESNQLYGPTEKHSNRVSKSQASEKPSNCVCITSNGDNKRLVIKLPKEVIKEICESLEKIE